eukprot:Skav225951  [mRNA]  locus=scaffold1500:647706:649272:- [translate_table: standard]
MSGSDAFSGFRRGVFGAETLCPKDVQGLQACKGHYESTGCENHLKKSFEVKETKYRITSDVKSSDPVTPRDLENRGQHGFLHREAREIETHFQNLQSCVKDRFGSEGMVFHLPAMIVAQEWRVFASSDLVLWDAPYSNRKEILEKRNKLLRKIINDRKQLQGMTCFSLLAETLSNVGKVLDNVLKRWEVYNAQETLPDQLKKAHGDFDQIVLDAIDYSVFGFLGVDIGEAFVPKLFIKAENSTSKLQEKLKRLASTSFGKMLKTFLLDPWLSPVLSIDTSSIAQITGGITAFPKLSEPVQEEQWQDFFRSLGLEKPPARMADLFGNARCHGLVETSGCGLEPDDCCKVLEEILKLWEAIRAAAKAQQLLQKAADVAHVGGELMLSRQGARHCLAWGRWSNQEGQTNLPALAAECVIAAKSSYRFQVENGGRCIWRRTSRPVLRVTTSCRPM